MRLCALVVAVAILGTFATPSARADCVCRCMNGTMRALCQSTMEVPPVCGAAICPVVPPSVPPVESATLPPLGTSRCRNVQVLAPESGNYEWKRVCR
jgi:hypothetical protein